MSIEAILPINVDFCNQKYISINAKQYDRDSRFLLVTCYNGGVPFILSVAQHSAYIRYKKPDGYSVFEMCSIKNGKVLVPLTEQMLAVQGTCVADLIVVDKDKVYVNTQTGQISPTSKASVISTMTFYINVTETPIDNAQIESTYDYSGLNKALAKAEASYQEVILASKSWAVGGTGIRTGEDSNNAKFWAEEAKRNATGQISVVTGIKCTNDLDYRDGQVTITAHNVGAVPVGTAVLNEDIATVDEVMIYLGIK